MEASLWKIPFNLSQKFLTTKKTRSRWIISYAACPIVWASKLQTQLALSMTEVEYISLFMSLRDVIHTMQLLEEMKGLGIQVICTKPHVYCKVFEDNFGALEMAHSPKLCPRTKHIMCYHHFHEHLWKGLIKIFPIDTENQIANALTKPLAQNSFCQHCHMCSQ